MGKTSYLCITKKEPLVGVQAKLLIIEQLVAFQIHHVKILVYPALYSLYG